MLKLASVVAVASLTWSACAAFDDSPEVAHDTEHVVNGTPVVDYPTSGGLLFGDNPSDAFMQCTGTLVGCDTFVTAAHCVCADVQTCNQPFAPSSLWVYLQNAGVYGVESVTAQPGYQFPGFGDIAVIKLTEPVKGIVPTPIITSNPPVNAQLTIVGYGLTFNDEGDSGIKREGALQRVSCNNFSDNSHMCFNPGSSPSVSCSGDSGGPNYIDIGGTLHLGAVVSGGGTQNSCTGGQKFATNVSGFSDFVNANAGPLGLADSSGAVCGGLPAVTDAGAVVETATSVASPADYTIEVPPLTSELRVNVNSINGSIQLYVREGETAGPQSADCINLGRMVATCTITSPAAGTYHVHVRSQEQYQVAMTAIGGNPSGEGESYEALDGEILEIAAGDGVLVNDTAGHGGALVAQIVTPPENGQLNLGPDGDFSYLPVKGFTGLDTFTYQVNENGYTTEPLVVTIDVTEPGGCGCQSGGGGAGGLAALGFIALLAFRQRRRR